MTQYVFVDESISSGQKKRTFEPEGEDVQPRSSVPSVLKTHCFFLLMPILHLFEHIRASKLMQYV